jgi:transcriptional regulator with XRE-family HTH domain
MAKTNGHSNGNRGVLRMYRSYNNVTKDPAIDMLRTAMRDEGIGEHEMATLSGVGESTIKNWFGGQTKRPQHITLAAAAKAMGYDWTLKHATKMNYEQEMPKAEKWQERRKVMRLELRATKG